jgi:hypothetical protein
MPSFAASVVRTFALTEIFIPIYHVKAERNAQIKNAIQVFRVINMLIITNKTIATTATVLYCLFRKAFAQS